MSSTTRAEAEAKAKAEAPGAKRKRSDTATVITVRSGKRRLQTPKGEDQDTEEEEEEEEAVEEARGEGAEPGGRPGWADEDDRYDEELVEWLVALGIDKADSRKYAMLLKRLGVDAADDLFQLEEKDLDEVAMKKLHRKKVLDKLSQRGRRRYVVYVPPQCASQ